MDDLLLEWLRWYHGGMGVDSRGVEPQIIIDTVKTLDLTQFTNDVDDWHYSVLYECIRQNKPPKRHRHSKTGKEFTKTYGTQRTDKGFFNIIIRRK